VENNRRLSENLIYSLLGVIKNRRVFLYFPEDEGYSLLILAADSTASGGQRRGFIRVDHEELAFNDFDLSEDGILSALLATDWEARVVWWRTDRLAGEIAQ
jgi:hypothetical protein